MPAKGARAALQHLRLRMRFARNNGAFRDHPVGTALRVLGYVGHELAAREVRFRTRSGLRFASPQGNYSAYVMCLFDARDPALWAVIERRVGPGATFVDVGANIGTYAVPAARLVGPQGSVIAFEAHPRIFGFLQRNVAANRLANVRLVNRALGAEPGSVEIAYAAHNPGETHVAVAGAGGGGGSVHVPMTTLDAAIAEAGVGPIDYLKIDVEGFELPVLRGARATIAASPNILVQTEMDAAHAGRYGHRLEDIAALLGDLGLRPHQAAEGGTLVPLQGDLVENTVWLRG